MKSDLVREAKDDFARLCVRGDRALYFILGGAVVELIFLGVNTWFK